MKRKILHRKCLPLQNFCRVTLPFTHPMNHAKPAPQYNNERKHLKQHESFCVTPSPIFKTPFLLTQRNFCCTTQSNQNKNCLLSLSIKRARWLSCRSTYNNNHVIISLILELYNDLSVRSCVWNRIYWSDCNPLTYWPLEMNLY